MASSLRWFKRRIGAICASAALVMLCGVAQAQSPGIHDPDAVVTAVPGQPTARPVGGTVILDFESLGDQEAVNEFYNGGTGGSGSGPGPNFGVSFSSNSLAIIDQDAGGSGNFGGEPSPDTVLFFLTGAAATVNIPAGFSSGFSFFYSAISNPGVIQVYDGLNATGNVLATLNLPLTPNTGAPDPSGNFSPLVPIGVTFTGTARSVDFGGTVNQVAFDNITLGSATPGGGGGTPPPGPSTPVPTLGPAWLLLLVALVLLGVLIQRRKNPR